MTNPKPVSLPNDDPRVHRPAPIHNFLLLEANAGAVAQSLLPQLVQYYEEKGHKVASVFNEEVYQYHPISSGILSSYDKDELQQQRIASLFNRKQYLACIDEGYTLVVVSGWWDQLLASVGEVSNMRLAAMFAEHNQGLQPALLIQANHAYFPYDFRAEREQEIVRKILETRLNFAARLRGANHVSYDQDFIYMLTEHLKYLAPESLERFDLIQTCNSDYIVDIIPDVGAIRRQLVILPEFPLTPGR